MSVLKARTRKGTHTVFSGSATLGTVVPANNYRQNIILQNTGTATLYFGFSTAIGTGTALQLASNTSFVLEQHTGPIYGVTAGSATTTVQVCELTESNSVGVQVS